MSSTSHAGSTSSIDIPQGLEDAPLMSDLDEIAALQRAVGPLYLRYSPGPVVDARTGSHDQESGCDLPGLAAAPLTPEPCGTGPRRSGSHVSCASTPTCGCVLATRAGS